MSDTIQIRLVDQSMPIPAYHTDRAAAFDLYSREDQVIEAGAFAYVPLNVSIKLPEGYWGLLAARSSLHKKGLAPLNGIGIIDPDYCGDNDEYKACLYNFSKTAVEIKKGERIMQVLPVPVDRFPIECVAHLGEPDRGGFGSTSV